MVSFSVRSNVHRIRLLRNLVRQRGRDQSHGDHHPRHDLGHLCLRGSVQDLV